MSLAGKYVVVTRARNQASELKEKLEQYGAKTIEFPVIAVVASTNDQEIAQILASLDNYQWILFTSANAAQFFFARMEQYNLTRNSVTARIAAVGPKTARAVENLGGQVDVVAENYRAEGLALALKPHLQAGARVLLPRANIARPSLPQELISWGANVTELTIYDTVKVTANVEKIVEQFVNREIHAVTFTSSSTVQNFCESLPIHRLPELLTGVKIASIGPVTAETARHYGLHVDIIASDYTIDGLVVSLQTLFKEEEE
jgi:uroporphyrinogen III methyltransferase/synthase